jgi:hypothetical protein
MSGKPEKISGPYLRFDESAEFKQGTLFDHKPTSLVLIAALEIVVEDDFGTYLLLTSPRYDDVEIVNRSLRRPIPEGPHWTLPYISKTIEAPAGGYKDVLATLRAAKQYAKDWGPMSKLEVYANAMFGGITIEPGKVFYELKKSWSQPQVTKLYRIMRYTAELGNCEANTLADAESRKGISFMPIDERYDQATASRECDLHERTETLYLSQPVESNVADILKTSDDRRGLGTRAIKLDRSAFFREYVGLLFCGDIAGYGAASTYAESHMADFSEQDHGALLRDSASVAFTDLFLDAGVSQVHTAGDGFICAIPLAMSTEPDISHDAGEAFQRFSHAYSKYVESLDALSQVLDHHFKSNHGGRRKAPVLGSRLAIHFGKYRYGKMSQAVSLLTGFDGREIVVVSRLEQGLRTVAKTPSLASQHDIKGIRHISAASREAGRVLGGLRKFPDLFQSKGRFKAASKEFSSEASLLAVVCKVAVYRRSKGANF